MRNWPYAWALGQARRQPGQGQDRRRGPAGRRRRRQAHRHAGRLAARRLGLLASNPEAAVDLVALPDLARRSRSGARSRAPTTRPSRALYKDQEVLAAEPFFGDAATRCSPTRWRGPSRVTGIKYNQVSSRVLQRGPRGAEPRSRGAGQPRRAREEARPAVARRALVAAADGRAASRRQRRRAAPAVADGAGRASRLTRQRTRAAWLFVAPMLLVLALVAGWPLAPHHLVRASPTPTSPTSTAAQFVGFDNFTLPADRSRLVERGPEHAGVHRRLGDASRPSSASASRWRSTRTSAAAACCAPRC